MTRGIESATWWIIEWLLYFVSAFVALNGEPSTHACFLIYFVGPTFISFKSYQNRISFWCESEFNRYVFGVFELFNL